MPHESPAKQPQCPSCNVATRRRLPDTRQGITHKFRIGTQEGYFNVGFFPDGTPGELFIEMQFQGSVVSGFADAWAIAFSMLLQSGWPLETLIKKYKGVRFEPMGNTSNVQIPIAESIVDYVVRFLEIYFLPK